MENAQAMMFRPTAWQRFWRALGFRFAAHTERPEDDEARYTIHKTVTHWDWRDRLRILVSGVTEIELCVETVGLPEIKGVRTDAAVLIPGVKSPANLLRT